MPQAVKFHEEVTNTNDNQVRYTYEDEVGNHIVIVKNKAGKFQVVKNDANLGEAHADFASAKAAADAAKPAH